MKKGLGQQIVEGLSEAVAYERGELAARTTRVAFTARNAVAERAPTYTRERIAQLRERLSLSQPVFAMALNVSPDTVRAWEQGKREPEGAALRLLQLTERYPAWVLDTIQSREAEVRSDNEE